MGSAGLTSVSSSHSHSSVSAYPEDVDSMLLRNTGNHPHKPDDVTAQRKVWFLTNFYNLNEQMHTIVLDLQYYKKVF